MLNTMKNCLKLLIAISISLFSVFCSYASNKISPLDFGLKEAKTGIERYWVLYNTHVAALESDATVDYKGIDRLDIEIPKDAKSIPLTSKTDFRGMTLTVVNNSKSFFLYEMTQPETIIEVSARDIDNGTFQQYDELKFGLVMLVLEDKNLWVKQRKGYNYGHTRRDVILIRNGRAYNIPVSGYNNAETSVKASFFRVNNGQKSIKDLKLYRSEQSSQKTYLVNLNNQYNVVLSGIVVYTPPSNMIGDQAFRITNCCHVSFKDISIDGTYSATDNYGYGVSMNNVYDIRFERLTSKSAWGIFGNNNVSNVTLKDCDINRFDVHCYGKDIYMKKCVFRDLYNQFSSMRGKVVFDKCTFIDFTPYLHEYSYNAYADVDIEFHNCVVYASKKHNYLIDARSLNGGETDERAELRIQHFPNLYVKGLKVILDEGMDTYYTYKLGRNMEGWDQQSLPGEAKIKGVKVLTK